MIHPSYYELMEKINKDSDGEDTPVISSRYSIILATSKRARQLINGASPKVNIDSEKPLSVAVSEIYDGLVNIIPEDSKSDAAEVQETSEAAVEAEEVQ